MVDVLPVPRKRPLEEEMTPATSNDSIWVVIPAFNEMEVIGSVVRDLLAKQYSVVVIDDCSEDETSRIAYQNGAHVLRHIVNLGQGAALQTGIEFALSKQNVEVTLGSRFLPGAAAKGIPAVRRLVLLIATSMSRLTTGLALTDTHNGLRGMRRSAAEKIALTQNRMAHASEFLAQVAHHKLRYCEVPVTISYNEYSLAKGQRLSNSFNVMWELMLGFLRL
jgi:glycosyltransferase involved in cell wall biosynthesis